MPAELHPCLSPRTSPVERSAVPCQSALSLVLDVNEQPGLPMPMCTDGRIALGKVGRRAIEAAFDGGDLASDGGVVLLRQVDERIGLTRAAARVFADRRRQASVTHGVRDMLVQRVYALSCGREDYRPQPAAPGLGADAVMQDYTGSDALITATFSAFPSRSRTPARWRANKDGSARQAAHCLAVVVRHIERSERAGQRHRPE